MVGDHRGGRGRALGGELLDQISERLQEGQLVINMSWKKSQTRGLTV